MKTIEVVVSPSGETSLTTKGFLGPACREASLFLECALGAQIGEQLTAEYHTGTSTISIQQQQGA